MKDLLRIASLLDNSGQFVLSDKLFKIAQQGRLNLDKQIGVENFREELKAMIGKSLVRNKLNPLQFVVDFKKLNNLLLESPLYDYVVRIQDIKIAHKLYPDNKNAKGMFVPSSYHMYIPAVYDAENLSTVLHEVVHSVDPVSRYEPGKLPKLIKEDLKDRNRPYYNRRDERLAWMENLHNFYSEEKLKKVLEIFYIKDKKKYPTQELAKKAFINDLKNYTQNPQQSILLQPSRFHSYIIAVNEGNIAPDFLLLNSYKPPTPEEEKSIFGLKNPNSREGREIWREYLRNNPERTEARDIQFYGQLKKFFTNVYLNTESKILPNKILPGKIFPNSNSVLVRPYDAGSTISLDASKNWLAKLWSKLENVPVETALQWIDYITFKRKDLFNKFTSTLHTLNIVLDESFNFQDPRWQILEPIVEMMSNELINYLENPKQYKSSLSVDQKAVNKSINPYKAWQELVLSYKKKYKTPKAILSAIRRDNPTIKIQIPNFASGKIFDKPFSMGNQVSKPFNELETKIQDNIIYMINNNGALPPEHDDTPNLNYNKMQELKMQK